MLARRAPSKTRTPRTAPAIQSDDPPASGVRRSTRGRGRRTRARELRQGLREFHQGLVDLRPELYGRALRISRSSVMAEDLVQDTVERALRFEAHYKQGTNLRAWVHQILFSVFMTRCRQSRRERNALEALVTDPLAWTYPDERINDMSSLPPALARALGDLPVGFRHALELVDLDELAYKEAAALLDVPVGTVMSRLHRGRRLLAESLRSSEEETSPAAPPSSRSTPLKSRPTSPAAPATSRPVLLKSLSISPAARPAPRSRRSQGAVAEAA